MFNPLIIAPEVPTTEPAGCETSRLSVIPAKAGIQFDLE